MSRPCPPRLHATRVSLFVAVLLLCASPAAADRIIGIENVTQNLHEIDPVTFNVTLLGPSGIPATVFGAARSGDPGCLFATTDSALYKVDVDNMTSTLVGNYNGAATIMRELAYLAGQDRLLGTDYTVLYEIDQTTAQCTMIGNHNGPTAVWAMALVGPVGLRGISGGQYYAFNVGTGVGTVLGTSISGVLDFTYDPATNTLLGSTNAQMYTFDLATGAATPVGGAIPNMLGWARVTDPVSAAQFRRGDVNGDGSANIQDAIAGLAYLFTPGTTAPDCLDAADTNDDGSVNLPDIVSLLGYLFVPGSTPPAAPGPDTCGDDGAVDTLAICTYVSC